MALWAASARRKRNTAPYFVQAIAWIMLVWLILIGITLGFTLRYSLETLQEKIDETLESVVVTLADSPLVRQALETGQIDPVLADYLDDLVENTTDLDVITIADEQSVRVYHVNKERIGQTFVGGDEKLALQGHTYFSDATGTMGYQHRCFCPVYDTDGELIGFVMSSTTYDRINQLRADINSTYLKFLGLLTGFTVVFCAALTIYLQKTLRGAKPEELVRTYLTQNDILNSLEEGIISIDTEGKVRLVNRAAEKTLGQREELLLDQSVDDILRGDNGDSLLNATGEDLATNHPNLLVNSINLASSSRWARQVLILKDKSEAFRRAEQLNGTRHIVSSLRANNHEFMNKLQIIAGLLQMGQPEEALNYIGVVSATHAQIITPVMQLIHNSNVAALILGKLDNMRELDVHMTLLANSHLPEHSRYLTTRELVTVVGNLLENAIEAVNADIGDQTRSVVLQITEDGHGLLIMISDSGIGIAPEHLPHIFEPGFSTKAAEGRGVGMNLVKSIVERREGSIEVDSEPRDGTTFTLIFNKERGGNGL